MKFRCIKVDTENRMFTAGKDYLADAGPGQLLRVTDDMGQRRYLPDEQQPTYVIGNPSTSSVYAHFKRLP